MQINKKIFRKKKILAVDDYFEQVMYNKKFGYYIKKNPLGKKGDFITSPLVSNIFSEMIAIWLINAWESIGKPKMFNIIELGPGSGNLAKTMLKTFQNFINFSKSLNFFLYERSPYLEQLQKNKIKGKNVFWINNLSKIKNGPTFFIGNEFFDAFPVKQYFRKNNSLFEKFLKFKKEKIIEFQVPAKKIDETKIKKFNCIKKAKFFEYPKLGLKELEKISKKIKKNTGGILLIDYGDKKTSKVETIQSVKSHKFNKIFENISDADITSYVNFSILKEFFEKNNFKVKKLVDQSYFLKKLGIMERANFLSNKMTFRDKIDLYYRIDRLTNINQMGKLFKVFFSYNTKNNNYIGFS